MRKKIKNQRSAGKIIPLHSKFTELANDVSRDKCVGAPKKVGSLHKVLKYMDKRKTTIIENDFGKW